MVSIVYIPYGILKYKYYQYNYTITWNVEFMYIRSLQGVTVAYVFIYLCRVAIILFVYYIRIIVLFITLISLLLFVDMVIECLFKLFVYNLKSL